MELKLKILSTILLLLTLSNNWHTEAIVVPLEKQVEDLFVGGGEDGNVETRREFVGSQVLEYNVGFDDLNTKETEAVLIPAR
ncbi:unnamed protein product [Rodentolepis nana]|uniref:Uncharacterized protein n=1 Tax=Rodentolepis nana TaxID=102285 RepID=A0A0R3TCX5_RODNA|nr:unnamed protein product [Rodentolepis nana]